MHDITNLPFSEPQLFMHSPAEGTLLVPDSVVMLSWTTRAANAAVLLAATITDVRLELWFDRQFVTMLAHGVPNSG